MLDLDKYMNLSVEVQLFGEVYHIRQATLRNVMEIERIEKEQTKENYFDTQIQIAKLVLDNNAEGRKFKREELLNIPLPVLNLLVEKVGELKKQVENDPN